MMARYAPNKKCTRTNELIRAGKEHSRGATCASLRFSACPFPPSHYCGNLLRRISECASERIAWIAYARARESPRRMTPASVARAFRPIVNHPPETGRIGPPEPAERERARARGYANPDARRVTRVTRVFVKWWTRGREVTDEG